jgi:hypothetical protein
MWILSYVALLLRLFGLILFQVLLSFAFFLGFWFSPSLLGFVQPCSMMAELVHYCQTFLLIKC